MALLLVFNNELLVAGGFDKNGFSKTVDIFQLK